jgi:uncharacterized protein with PQ loop repeat
MTQDPGLIHQHLRKRFANNFETYPHPDKFKRFVDRLIYVVSIVGPLFSLPQLIEIWGRHNAASISLFTWTSYCVLTTIWLTYGILHREKPIIYSQSMWLICNLAVTIGAAIYS